MKKKRVYVDASTKLNMFVVTDDEGKVLMKRLFRNNDHDVSEMEALAIVGVITEINEPVKIKTDSKSVYREIRELDGFSRKYVSERAKHWCMWIKNNMGEKTIQWIPRKNNLAGKYIEKQINKQLK